jgi:hypothetical protein
MSFDTSEVKFHMTGRQVKSRGPVYLTAQKKASYADLAQLGMNFSAMDSALIGPAVANGGIPESALTTWLAGTIRALTTPNDIDEIAGITTVGEFQDEKLKIRVFERFGRAERYSDGGNIPLAGGNPGVEERAVARFEQGFSVGYLEGNRLSAAGYDVANEKRRAAAESLDISRNLVGMRGLAGTLTYGLLNDPNLSAMRTTTVNWANTTFENLVNEFTALRNLLDQQMGTALSDDAQFVFVLPTGYRGIMNMYNTSGQLSFKQWLTDNYPNLRVKYVPGFVGAGADGADVCYLIVEGVANLDESDIVDATLIQAVPARFFAIGSKQEVKEYVEDFANATAGVIVVRPWAIVRSEVSVTE